MKIEGTVNIMGMREIIFGHMVSGKFYPIVNYIKLQKRWVRLTNGVADGFFRNEERMISSIKALAYNPNVHLTFNDGAMYVEFIHSISQKNWKRIMVYTKEHKKYFADAMREMLDS